MRYILIVLKMLGGEIYMRQIPHDHLQTIGTEMAYKLRDYVRRTPKIVHLCTTSEPHVKLYANCVQLICSELNIQCDTIMTEKTNVTNYAYAMSEIQKLNDTDYDGILYDFPFKWDPSIRDITSQISPSKDIECVTPELYGRYILGLNKTFNPCIKSTINDLMVLHGFKYISNDVLIISECGEPYGLFTDTLSNITLTHPLNADKALSQLSDYDVIISLLYNSKYSITKETVPFPPTSEQMILDFGWCTGTTDSTISPDIFNLDRSTYYDLSNGLMTLYIYNALTNLLIKLKGER